MPRTTGKRSSVTKPSLQGRVAPVKRSLKKIDIATIASARRGKMPSAIEPELALLVSEAPHTADWVHEIKFDGYRLLCHVTNGKARLMTRRQLDWTARFPTIAQAATNLPIKSVILDGEAVVLEPNGVSSFQALQSALSEKAYDRMLYYVFDILYLDWYDLRGVTLEERKSILASVLATQTATSRIRYCDHIEGDGPEFLRQCCGHGLEGIISKRRDRPYLAGRGGDWVKAKCIQHEEFVIGGFTDPTASRQGFGAILIGYYDRPGNLLYAGRVGTGFSTQKLVDLRRMFDKLESREPTFANLTPRQAGRGVHWIKPKLVCQVEFTNWTRDHVLRHPSFQGLREDLPATAVVRDAPVPGGLAEGAKTGTVRRETRAVKKSVAARRRGASR